MTIQRNFIGQTKIEGISIDSENDDARARDAARFEATGIHYAPPSWVDPETNGNDTNSAHVRTTILPPSLELRFLAAEFDDTLTERPCLILRSGQTQGRTFSLLPADTEVRNAWVIGSEANCDIQLNEVGVSALHAVVAYQRGLWTLVDQQSASGTYVNGKPCLKKVLHDGDQLQFGRIKSSLHIPDAYRCRPDGNGMGRLIRALKALAKMPFTALNRMRSPRRLAE